MPADGVVPVSGTERDTAFMHETHQQPMPGCSLCEREAASGTERGHDTRPARVMVDVTASVPSACCGDLPYRMNDGPWRCGGCARDVPAVYEAYVREVPDVSR